ncbi:hypothetical protein [Pseudomonas sp. GM17]|uniref:hypothetical protein n=1 Tax=Pseudomonas sp. GM17 TaxID=1144323 RepID=UPI001EE65547|nr:hypothetical protein [Pseudomonas sp. GM17]WIE49813.1 hypothetical protein PMI20_029595 [Pseudomonas sp. GM17]
MNYPFKILPADVVEIMQRCASINPRETPTHLLKVFEAYCHVTKISITFFSLSSPAFLNVMKGFLGSLADDSLIALGVQGRQRYRRGFVKLLDEMRREIPLIPSLSNKERMPWNNQHLWEKAKQHLDPKAVRYWNGWNVRGRKDNVSFIPINLIWNSHGEEFAEEVYKNYRQNSAKYLAPSHSNFKLFLAFLSQNAELWPTASFKHPVRIKKLFIEYMVFNFKQALEIGTDIATRTRSYAKFITQMDETFIQSGLWARPFTGQLPRPTSSSTPGSHTNIRKTACGVVVKDKLITSVPLQISDSEAIDILFKKILDDNKLVLKWSKQRLFKSRKAQVIRDQLALMGTPNTEKNPLINHSNEFEKIQLCTTLNTQGLAHLRENYKNIANTLTKDDAAKILAIPKAIDFLALQLMLTYYHPCLTESFFAHFELYDKRGNISGFLKTDQGYQLIGYKDRKGGALSEQKVDLTPRQAAWVRRIISLTQPLRDELHKTGDDAWRYLFLHCARAISYPKRPIPFKINKGNIDSHQRTLDEFSALSDQDENSIRDFLTRISVTSYRASSGVEVYLKTNSVEAMAKALGHTAYHSSLLSCYLPEPILAFFQTRWIQIFQRGIICEAMKESPRLLDVAKFQSMEELHEFLENHALREIPEHLQNPDFIKTKEFKQVINNNDKHADRVLISIDAGVLTALISLKEAVSLSQTPSNLCSKAIYWSKFTDLVVKEIEDGFNSDLQDHLNVAKQYANASHMESLIYASSS